MDADSIDSEAQKTLNDVAQNIHDTCLGYSSELADAWGIPTQSKPLHLPEHLGAAECFILGLTQWIVSQAITHGLKASVRSFMTYRTGSGAGDDDIVSLAIRFKPDPYIQPDTHGLVRPTGTAVSLEDRECEQSKRIPKLVRARVLVDEVLRLEATEFERCLVESSELLSSAGYDSSSYRDWVMQESSRYATQ
jgi:hypothetical protein